MPDISMCDNNKCHVRETCYRFKVKPNPYRQSYGFFGNKENTKCEYYSEFKPGGTDND